MDYIDINGIKVSWLALGCMRISDKPKKNIDELLFAAEEIGVNLLDNADIYGGGMCETLIGDALDRTGLRHKFRIQTKCGIRAGWYDLSKEHIIESVDNSLKRLKCEHIDFLLLHRPDTLFVPDEVAAAFDELYAKGKVSTFGVSNFSSAQVALLQSATDKKLYINQLQLSPTFCPLIESGIVVNTPNECQGGGELEYHRLHGITIQTYGTVQSSYEENGMTITGALLSPAQRKAHFSLAFELDGLAQKYDTTPDAVLVAWILRHPANMQAIVGTTSAERLKLYKDCCDIPLSAREWYKIYGAEHRIP